MLSHLSTKFSVMPQAAVSREPRAALFINRYTRTQTIMYATEGLSSVLGITGAEMHGKSLYYCIERSCLKDAVTCLENAKANDSIAYLRFWWRDPRLERDADEDLPGILDRETSDDSEDDSSSQGQTSPAAHHPIASSYAAPAPISMRDSSSSGVDSGPNGHEGIFGEPRHQQSGGSATSGSERQSRSPSQPIECEAVISCTSDGLVVCLRIAAPFTPEREPPWQEQPRPTYNPQDYPVYGRPRPANMQPQQAQQAPLQQIQQQQMHGAAQQQQQQQRLQAQSGPHPSQQARPTRQYNPVNANGMFAAPWSTPAQMPPMDQQLRYGPTSGFHQSGQNSSLYPQSSGPRLDFMNSIKEMAVFAWALLGINGALVDHGRGTPRGESQPSGGLNIWKPENTQLADDGCLLDHSVPHHTQVDSVPQSGIAGGRLAGVSSSAQAQQQGQNGTHVTRATPIDSAVDWKSGEFGRGSNNYEVTVGVNETNNNAGQLQLQDHRTLPGLETLRQPKQQSPSATRGYGSGQPVDGVDSPPGLRHASTSSNETPGHPVNYGFGDPGLSSRTRKQGA